jgi:hypothetical protein
MTDERLKEIYDSVVVNAFYTVGREQFLSSDITHEEMKAVVRLAFESRFKVAGDGRN